MDVIIHLEDEQIRKLKYIQQQTNQDPETLLNPTLTGCQDKVGQFKTMPETSTWLD